MTREIEWLDGWPHIPAAWDPKQLYELGPVEAFKALAARVAVLEQWHREATARPPEVGKVHGMMHSAPEPVIAQPREDDGLAGLIEGMRKAIEGTGFHGGVDRYWPALARHVQSLIAAGRRKFTKELSDIFHHGSMTDLAEYVRALGDRT